MIHFLIMAFSMLFWWHSPVSGEKILDARWNSRLLAYVVTSEEERAGIEATLAASIEEMEDRDLLLVNLGEVELSGADSLSLGEEEKRVWRELWGMGLSETRFILVGKDGSPKALQRGTLEPSLFFDLIDTMPMRRAEVRARGDR